MNGKELVTQIEETIKNNKLRKGQNIMGCSESFYDTNYLIYSAFKENNDLETLKNLDEQTIKLLFKVADFAAEVFY